MGECANGEMRDLLPELMHGQLDAALTHAVEGHVAECVECAEELSLLRSLRPELLREPVIDTERIAAAVRARTTAAPQRAAPRRAAPWRLLVAAAVVLAASAAGYKMVTRERAAPEGAVAVSPTHIPTTTVGIGALGNLSDLSDEDLRSLTTSLEGISAVPDVAPAPDVDPLGASLDAHPAGGA